MLHVLNFSLGRRPPQHGGKAAAYAFEEQRREIREILATAGGVEARVMACADVLPPRRHQAATKPASKHAPKHAATEAKHGAMSVARAEESRVPPLAGWPRFHFEKRRKALVS